MDLKDIVTVSEFVRGPKVFLDTTLGGTPVYLRRGNDVFKLVNLPAKVTYTDAPADVAKALEFAKPVEMPHVSSAWSGATPVAAVGTPVGDWTPQEAQPLNELLEDRKKEMGSDELPEDFGEKSCCRGMKPCVHWQWQEQVQLYINTLSGRTREAAA